MTTARCFRQLAVTFAIAIGSALPAGAQAYTSDQLIVLAKREYDSRHWHKAAEYLFAFSQVAPNAAAAVKVHLDYSETQIQLVYDERDGLNRTLQDLRQQCGQPSAITQGISLPPPTLEIRPLLSSTAQMKGQIGPHSTKKPYEILKLARTIEVVSATYGANCGAPAGNVTKSIAAACDGSSTCSYVVNKDVIGDPVRGCAKDYQVEYSCRGSGNKKMEKVAAEAGYGSAVQLVCP